MDRVISNLQEVLISSDRTWIYGRCVEQPQMPDEWIVSRGYPEILDVRSPDPNLLAKKIVEVSNERFCLTRRPGLIINSYGCVAIDIRALDWIGRGELKNPILKIGLPDYRDIIVTDWGNYEPLWFQARRVASSVFGEEPKWRGKYMYGPPIDRFEDVVDLLRYTSYYGGVELKPPPGLMKKAGWGREAARMKGELQEQFTAMQKYWSQPEVLAKYPGAEQEFGAMICGMKFGIPYKREHHMGRPK